MARLGSAGMHEAAPSHQSTGLWQGMGGEGRKEGRKDYTVHGPKSAHQDVSANRSFKQPICWAAGKSNMTHELRLKYPCCGITKLTIVIGKQSL